VNTCYYNGADTFTINAEGLTVALNINLGDVIMVRPNYFDQIGNVAYNVLHYQLHDVSIAGGGVFTGELATTLLPLVNQAFATGVMPVWAAAANEQIGCSGITSQAIFPAPRSAAVTTMLSEPVMGAEVGQALPLQDTLTLLKRTAVGQRWGLGRFYFVGLGEAQQENGIMTTDHFDDMQALALELKDNLTFSAGIYTYVFRPVLWTNPSVALPAGRVTPITNVVLSDAILKTQRRRRPGKGI